MKIHNKKAVALEYDGYKAPVVTVKGDGLLAEEILQRAEMYEIPIHEEPELVQFLSQVELGDEIPEFLFLAVAQVLAFTYLLKEHYPVDSIKQDQVKSCDNQIE